MTVFAGLKVLIVEDESIVALMIEDILESLGCEILASVADVAQALELAAKADIDLAMLDVNVAGQPVFPVAKVLRQRRIPFLFSTGYSAGALPAEFSGQQVLGKPFSDREMQQKVALTLQVAL